MPDALGQLLELALLEGAAGVGGGLVDGIDGEVLECAAALHGSALLGRVLKRGWAQGGEGLNLRPPSGEKGTAPPRLSHRDMVRTQVRQIGDDLGGSPASPTASRSTASRTVSSISCA